MADRYLRASGNWNGPVWAATSSGVAGSAATPTIDDEVNIIANFTVTLTAAASAAAILHTNGTVALSSHKLTVDSNFVSSGTTSRTISLGSGTLEFTGNGLPEFQLSGSNLTFSAGTSLVIFNQKWTIGSSTNHFATGNKTFNDVRILMGGTSNSTTFNITGSPTFRSLIIQSKNSAAHTVNFDSGATITTNKFAAIGSSSSSKLTVKPSSGSSTIALSSDGSTYGQFVNMQANASGAGVPKYIGANSTQSSGMGWLLQDPPKATTLLDKFDIGSAPSSLWSTILSGTGYANVSGGKLTMGWSYGSSSSSTITSTDTYDFVGSETYVKVSSMSGDSIGISVAGIGLYAPIANTPSEIYYRIKGVESGSNTTVTIARQNGTTWTNLASVTVESPLARSKRLEIGGSRNLQSDMLVIDSVGESPGLSIDGTLLFSGGALRQVVMARAISGTLLFSGGASFIRFVESSISGTLLISGSAGLFKLSMRSIDGSLQLSGGAGFEYYNIVSASGTLLFSGGISSVMTTRTRSIEGTLVFGGSVRSIIIRDAETLQDKRYLYKVYDPDGNYIEVWKDVISDLTFTHEINTIGSSATIELARNSDTVGVSVEPLLTESGQNLLTEDDLTILAAVESKNQIGSGSSVDYNNRVDVTVFYGGVEPLYTESMESITTEDDEELLADIGAPNGRRIFTGFISEINSRYGNSETTIVQLTSYGWDLDQYPITTSDGKTTVPFLSKDPSQIAKEAVDKFMADSSTYGTYTTRGALSIDTTGTVVSYTFRANTYKDVLEKTLELMPSNWYFRVGLGDNLVYYKERSVTPDHLFYLGKHIKSLDLKGSIINSTNRVLFTGGGEPNLYIDRSQAPADRTRRTLKMMSDNRVTVQDSAEIIADGAIDGSNKRLFRTTIEILTKQYDIESISVGETVGFRNFGSEVDTFTMQVVGLSYNPSSVQLQLDSKPPTVSKRLEDIRRQLVVTGNQSLPDSPS